MLAFAILLSTASIVVGAGSVLAQSCGLQVGSVTGFAQYSGSYYGSYNPYTIQLIVPLSLSCANSGNPLWAVGTVYDTVTGTSLVSNNIAIGWTNGYSGQLTFNLPTSVVGHLLQVQVQVYNSYSNGQYGGLVATASPTVVVNPSGYYEPTTSPGYYNGYPSSYYNGYNGYYYYQPGHPSSYYYNNGNPYPSYPYLSYPNYYYYYSYPSYYGGQSYYGGSCFNGQAIIYYNGAYYYVSCNSYYWHHHH